MFVVGGDDGVVLSVGGSCRKFLCARGCTILSIHALFIS